MVKINEFAVESVRFCPPHLASTTRRAGLDWA